MNRFECAERLKIYFDSLKQLHLFLYSFKTKKFIINTFFKKKEKIKNS